ncbi:translation elongation factor Ts [uncultured Zhongshania sp.]|jgi:elongation factor Ts|uniref:translation elongation factor Ts n=1 Tax=uncultured Zhongshania sp. TaxID=1642288 RepID=UPI0025E054AC|nr:translation elongation factor Ts [uncultured Zhongshania sp.]|tara:strand:- start:575 stop:1438 length:864 start_codon:yes stop_codon:yes gene_type:complete
MAVTASMVKELRDRTGLGMMECKKALNDANGDIELAIEEMRKSSGMKAAKKAGRTAADGVVSTKVAEDGSYGVVVEVNSETDFVARDAGFLAFVAQVTDKAFATKATDVAELMAGELESAREALVQKIGENISVRRAVIISAEDGVVDSYVHSNNRIAVLVALKGGDAELARDVAMHVAATNPRVAKSADMPEEEIVKEREIFTAQAAESGKPAEIIEKMIDGRIRKFLSENSLVDQPFVKDPEQTVGKLLKSSSADIQAFIRFEVGEGIEKEEVDFAAEVAAQLKG